MTHKKLSYRLGTFLAVVMLLLSMVSIYHILSSDAPNSMIYDYTILISISVFFFITRKYTIGRYVQVAGLCISAIGTVLKDPNIGLFILQLVIIYLIAEKYGFWQRNVVKKAIICLVCIIILLFLSFIIMERSFDDVIPNILFYFIFIVTFSIIKLDDMRSYFDNIKKLKLEISELNSELVEKDKILESLEPDFIDPIASGLTKAELKLLESLCTYRESNQELSKRLGKSENTIKTQLKSITQKIGVDNRHQLIEACKDYFYALKI